MREIEQLGSIPTYTSGALRSKETLYASHLATLHPSGEGLPMGTVFGSHSDFGGVSSMDPV